MSKKYNHMLDMAFSIETNEEDWYNIPKPAIIAALLRRISSIVKEDDSFMEAFGCCDTYEVEAPSSGGYENALPRLIKEMEDSPTYSETMQDELEPIEEPLNAKAKLYDETGVPSSGYFPESKIRGM